MDFNHRAHHTVYFNVKCRWEYFSPTLTSHFSLPLLIKTQMLLPQLPHFDCSVLVSIAPLFVFELLKSDYTILTWFNQRWLKKKKKAKAAGLIWHRCGVILILSLSLWHTLVNMLKCWSNQCTRVCWRWIGVILFYTAVDTFLTRDEMLFLIRPLWNTTVIKRFEKSVGKFTAYYL